MEDNETDLAVSEKKGVPDTEEVLSMFSESEAKKQVRRQQLWRRTSRSLGGNCDALFTVIHYHLHHADIFHSFTAKLEQIN